MRRHGLIALALVAVTTLAFSDLPGHDFVRYDDDQDILHNPLLRDGLSVESVARILTTPYHLNWIPLTTLSLLVDREIHGRDATGFLLTNLALHTLSTLVLYLALFRMTGAVGRSAFVAGVFAVHPLHVESVAWAAERKDVLAGLFWMLGLLAYAHYAEHPRSRARYAGVALCLVLGLLSKPMLVAFPFTLLALDYWPLGRLRGDASARGWRRHLSPARLGRLTVEKLPLLALIAGASALTLALQERGMAFAGELAFRYRLMNALVAYGAYLGDAIWPSGLAVLYPHPLESVSLQAALASAALLACVTAACIALAGSRPHLLAGWLLYLGPLVPVIGLVQVGMQARADRYMYLPLVGLSIAVAWEAWSWLGGSRGRRIALATAGTAAVAALAAGTWLQVRHWRDTLSLFTRALEVTEGNFLAHFKVAEAHLGAGRNDRAEAHFAEARRLLPGWPEPYVGLADVAARRGDREGAMRRYRDALGREPRHAVAHERLGMLLLEAGQLDSAQRHLEAARDAGAGSARLRAALGNVFEQRGEPLRAVAEYRASLRGAPGARAIANNLAWLLATHPRDDVRDPAEAIRIAEAAVRSGGETDPALLDTLAAAYAAGGRFEQAARTAERAAHLAESQGAAAVAREIRAHAALFRSGRSYRQDATESGEPSEAGERAGEASPP